MVEKRKEEDRIGEVTKKRRIKKRVDNDKRSYEEKKREMIRDKRGWPWRCIAWLEHMRRIGWWNRFGCFA